MTYIVVSNDPPMPQNVQALLDYDRLPDCIFCGLKCRIVSNTMHHGDDSRYWQVCTFCHATGPHLENIKQVKDAVDLIYSRSAMVASEYIDHALAHTRSTSSPPDTINPYHRLD